MSTPENRYMITYDALDVISSYKEFIATALRVLAYREVFAETPDVVHPTIEARHLYAACHELRRLKAKTIRELAERGPGKLGDNAGVILDDVDIICAVKSHLIDSALSHLEIEVLENEAQFVDALDRALTRFVPQDVPRLTAEHRKLYASVA